MGKGWTLAGKPIVIVCQCGGYHAKSACPKLWAEFNVWFQKGLKRIR